MTAKNPNERGAGRHVPMRMCVICRQRFEQRALTRHVLAEDNTFMADAPRKLPGRGWYLCSAPECVRKFASYRPKNKIRKNGRGFLKGDL